jgi:hypothetical protein
MEMVGWPLADIVLYGGFISEGCTLEEDYSRPARARSVQVRGVAVTVACYMYICTPSEQWNVFIWSKIKEGQSSDQVLPTGGVRSRRPRRQRRPRRSCWMRSGSPALPIDVKGRLITYR